MGIQDLVITPFFIAFYYFIAIAFRPAVTTPATRKYYLPALTLKFIGAFAVGAVYQFYYGGGDTFNYWQHGSNHIVNAFMENPILGIKMLLSNSKHSGDFFHHSMHIWYFRDESGYFVVRLAALLDILSFKTYSAVAVGFAAFSFSGLWMLYKTFVQLFPKNTDVLAYAILFVPSVVFWGSGLLKDTLTMGALGWVTYAAFNVFWFKKNMLKNTILLIFFSWVIYSIKEYILMAFLGALTVWVYSINIQKIKNIWLRTLIAPALLVFTISAGFLTLNLITDSGSRYALENIAETSMITAYDIRYGWGAGAGSGYSLGELDGSFSSMISLAPSAIGTTLFRPFLWEAGNPLMLLASVEATVIIIFTGYFLLRNPMKIPKLFSNPHLRLCLVFALVFSFAVGVSTFNFGSLSRYKIPMLPFYFISLVIMGSKNER